MLGAVRSGSLTWILPLKEPGVGEQMGAAGGKVTKALQVALTVDEAVNVPVAGASTVPVPLMVMGMLTLIELPPAALIF
jgi:hypothetical protein